jgi:hypothetical protein
MFIFKNIYCHNKFHNHTLSGANAAATSKVCSHSVCIIDGCEGEY